MVAGGYRVCEDSESDIDFLLCLNIDSPSSITKIILCNIICVKLLDNSMGGGIFTKSLTNSFISQEQLYQPHQFSTLSFLLDSICHMALFIYYTKYIVS